MNIRYDVRVDALHIKTIPGQHRVQTKHLDDDIVLDFDESDRLIGIEVLDDQSALSWAHCSQSV